MPRSTATAIAATPIANEPVVGPVEGRCNDPLEDGRLCNRLKAHSKPHGWSNGRNAVIRASLAQGPVA